MPKLPIISGKKLLNILTKNGFVAIRQHGSHVFIEDPVKNFGTVIPIHGNEDLGKGILKSILNDLELKTKDLHRMMK